MTREQYEHHKRRLEEQLRAGVAMLESAYQAQVRALDLVWMLQEEGSPSAALPQAPAARATVPPVEVPPRRRAPEIDEDVRAAFAELPETFTRSEVCEALGYEPDRGALYRTLQGLVRSGHLRVEAPGEGQKATVYRKTGADVSTAES